MSESQMQKKHTTILLKDYRIPDYRIETVNLEFELDETRTRVTIAPDRGLQPERLRGHPPPGPERQGPEAHGRSSSTASRCASRTTGSMRSRSRSCPCPTGSSSRSRPRSIPPRTRSCPASIFRAATSAPSARPRASARSPIIPTGPMSWRASSPPSLPTRRSIPCCSRTANLIDSGDLKDGQAFRQVARPVSQARIPLCARGRRPGAHPRFLYDHVRKERWT